MKFEVAQHDGNVYLTFTDPSLLTVIMSDVEDLIKSTASAGNFESAKEYIDLLLKLRKAYKEMRDSEKNEEPDGTRL